MSFWGIFKHPKATSSQPTAIQRVLADVTVDNSTTSYDQAVINAIRYSGHLGTLAQQDKQHKAITRAELKHKEDLDTLILFWEKLWVDGGLKFNGVRWHFRLVELYYKAKRYDDAWQILNEFVLSRPQYIINVRKWQIKVLKREKKDYSRIQQLLDSGQ